jgi:PAS domain-containing protein
MRRKILAFAAAITAVFIVLAWWAMARVRTSFRTEIETHLTEVARQTLGRIDRDIYAAIESLGAIAHDPIVQRHLEQANQRSIYESHGVGEPRSQAIHRMDALWVYHATKKLPSKYAPYADFVYGVVPTTPKHFEEIKDLDPSAIDSPFDIESLYTNELALLLNKKKAYFHEQFKYPVFDEMYITDAKGVIVGITEDNYTSDLIQSDEGWWNRAAGRGEGDALFVSDPKLDDSTGELAMGVALPICADVSQQECTDDQVIGVIKALFRVGGLRSILADVHLDGDKRLVLTDQYGFFIAEAKPAVSGDAPSTAEVDSRSYCLRLVGPSLQESEDITPRQAWSELDSCTPGVDGSATTGAGIRAPGQAGVCTLDALYFVRDPDQLALCTDNPIAEGCTGCNPGIAAASSSTQIPVIDHQVLVGWSVSAGHGPPGYRLWEGLGWRLFFAQPRQSAFAEIDRLQFQLLIALLSFLLVIAAGSAIMAAWLVRPLDAVRRYLIAIARGDLDEPAPVIRSADEVGQMSQAATDLAARIRRRLDEIDAVEHRANERVIALESAVADLRASKDQPGRALVYYAVIANSSRGIVALDEGERVVAVNARASALLGISPLGPERADSPSLTEVLSGDRLLGLRGAVERGRKGAPPEVVTLDRLEGGEVRVRVVTRSIIDRGAGGGFAIYLENATQESLRERYEALIEHFARCDSPCGDDLDDTSTYRESVALLEDAREHGESGLQERLMAIRDALVSCAEGQRVLRSWNDGERSVSLRTAWEKLQRADSLWPETAVCSGLERVRADLETALDQELQRD